MIPRLLCGALLLTCTVAAHAQYANIDGQFRSSSTSLDLIALDTEKGVVAASSSVTQGSCSGTVAGVGTMKGDTLAIRPYRKTEPDDACVIRITFAPNRNSASIKGEGCSSHAGAACGWEGDTVRRVRDRQR